MLMGDRNAHPSRNSTERGAGKDFRQVVSTGGLQIDPRRLLPLSSNNTVRFGGDTEAVPTAKSGRLAVRTQGKVVFIDPSHLSAVEAHGKYAVLRMSSRTYRFRESVSVVAERLRPYGFIRIHRSTIVNASLVEELRASDSGELLVRMQGGAAEYRVSRKYRTSLKSIASCWI
jgi:DNA-binding LytR/AlgR family response regulator